MRYSFDAARLPVRFAIACDPKGRELAASWWPVFATLPPAQIRDAYDLTGTPSSGAAPRSRSSAPRQQGTPRGTRRLSLGCSMRPKSSMLKSPATTALRGSPSARILLTTDRLGACPGG